LEEEKRKNSFGEDQYREDKRFNPQRETFQQRGIVLS
jgi:hypothetical protein